MADVKQSYGMEKRWEEMEDWVGFALKFLGD